MKKGAFKLGNSRRIDFFEETKFIALQVVQLHRSLVGTSADKASHGTSLWVSIKCHRLVRRVVKGKCL